jgi:hypothetical protein
MNETAPKARRTLRRALLVLAAIVLLPVVYVASWLGVSRAVNTGLVSVGVGETLRPAYKPLILYCDLKKPGTDTLHRLWWSVSTDTDAGARRDQLPGWFLSPSLPPPN